MATEASHATSGAHATGAQVDQWLLIRKNYDSGRENDNDGENDNLQRTVHEIKLSSANTSSGTAMKTKPGLARWERKAPKLSKV